MNQVDALLWQVLALTVHTRAKEPPMTTPVELLESRIAYYRALDPVTAEGRTQRDAVVHELLNCLWSLQLQAVNALHLAQIDAGLTK